MVGSPPPLLLIRELPDPAIIKLGENHHLALLKKSGQRQQQLHKKNIHWTVTTSIHSNEEIDGGGAPPSIRNHHLTVKVKSPSSKLNPTFNWHNGRSGDEEREREREREREL